MNTTDLYISKLLESIAGVKQQIKDQIGILRALEDQWGSNLSADARRVTFSTTRAILDLGVELERYEMFLGQSCEEKAKREQSEAVLVQRIAVGCQELGLDLEQTLNDFAEQLKRTTWKK